MRLPVFGALAFMAVSAATPIPIAHAADEALTPARDFSGVWTSYRAPGQPGGGAGGPMPRAAPPPFTPEGQRLKDEFTKLATPAGDNPAAYCVQYGMPTMMQSAGGYPIEFIHRPEQLTIIYEVESETRRVYMPGHGIPRDKRLPVRQGYSEGHWEGDTLVVETTDLSDGQDQRGYPHSDQAKIVERIKLTPDAAVGKILDYEATMTDPVYYTAPVSFKKRWMPLKDGHIMAYNCSEEAWLALLDARREQLKAGKPITAKMSDVIDVYK
ncbi:MAG: hypothetical protein J7494_09035 [Sphingobium sp.]|nr:hypothetical protein [Sphingobium sp.]